MNIQAKAPPAVPIAKVALGEDEIDAAIAVLRSGNLRAGRLAREFEERFAEAADCRFAVSVNSGTAALHTAYLAAFQPGDEVIVPAFTFVATASVLSIAGMVPVFADVDPYKFTIDLEDASRRVTPRTRGIAPVHLFGQACDMAAIRQFADERGLRVVADAAQATGTRYQGRDVDGYADLTCHSFYPTKNMTTGEGGMITTDDEALYERMQLLKSHGQSGKYHHTLLGLNYRLTDLAAAIGLVQLGRLRSHIALRRDHAARLTDGLRDVPGVAVPTEQAFSEHSYNLYTVLVDSNVVGLSRDGFADALRSKGIETAIHYPRPLHRQPIFSGLPADGLGVSERLCERVLSLPVHPALTGADVDMVVEAARSVAGCA